jgi:hypothetical protein
MTGRSDRAPLVIDDPREAGGRMSGTARAIATAVCVPASAQARTYVNDGEGSLVVRPAKWWGGSGIGGGVWRAEKMRWSSWGSRSAIARGTVIVNTCEPSCVAGNMKRYTARFRLYRPRAGCPVYDRQAQETRTVTKRLFTRVDIRFPVGSLGTWKTTPQEGGQC